MNKPTKPNITIPKSFAANGEKNDFNDDMLLNGFDRIKQEVVPGDALNKFINDSYQGLNYSMDGVDDLYKGIVLYSATETYNTTSLVFNISEAGIKLYHSLVNNNKGNSLTDATKWEEVSLGGGLPVGTIIPVTASSSHVPEGALPCDGAEYSASQFNELFTNWLVTKKLKTCTYTEYSNMIATYGQCPMWALDTTNRKFKVPLIKDGSVIQQALSNTEIGKAYNAGLPNTEFYANYHYQHSEPLTETGASGAVEIINIISTTTGNLGSSRRNAIIHYSASLDSDIYGNSDTVQMNAVAVRFFVVVATGSINQSQMDWSAWASSLASKANVDLSNVQASQAFIDKSIGWGMPDYSAGITMSTAINTAQLIQYDGLLHAYETSNYVQIDLCNSSGTTIVPNLIANAGYSNAVGGGSAFVSKGQYIKNIQQPLSLILYPLKGAK